MNEEEYLELYKLLGKLKYKIMVSLTSWNLKEETKKELQESIDNIDKLLAGGIPLEFKQEVRDHE